MRPIKVFLSSTYRDASLREAVRQTIDDLPGFISVVVEASPASMRAPEGVILDRILEADVFLIIIASYGTKLQKSGQSFGEYEYTIAAQAGKPIVALLDTRLGKRKSEDDAVWDFADRLKTERPESAVTYFDSVGSLRDRVATSLFKLRKNALASDFEIRFDPEMSEDQVKGPKNTHRARVRELQYWLNTADGYSRVDKLSIVNIEEVRRRLAKTFAASGN